MADDIDDLLDKWEQHLDKTSKAQFTKDLPKKRHSNDDDIRDILDESFSDEIKYSSQYKGLESKLDDKSFSSLSKSVSLPASLKCFNLLIGGSEDEMGITTPVSQRPCNNLRCTSCDFQVVSFNNYEWSPKVDYIFLRNNAPDFHRLEEMLTKKSGSRAYCCQCCSLSVAQIGDVAKLRPDLKWVCGRH